MITISRHHDISCGHRVCGHNGKCSNLHGHTYRITFSCTSKELVNGMVVDFAFIKSELCQWLEDNWDHRFLVWEKDPIRSYLMEIDKTVAVVPFNPTAENIAEYLLNVVCPARLGMSENFKGVRVISVTVQETDKCSATADVSGHPSC